MPEKNEEADEITTEVTDKLPLGNPFQESTGTAASCWNKSAQDSAQSELEFGEDDCAICLHTVQSPISPPCGRRFCSPCMIETILQRVRPPRCPTCPCVPREEPEGGDPNIPSINQMAEALKMQPPYNTTQFKVGWYSDTSTRDIKDATRPLNS